MSVSGFIQSVVPWFSEVKEMFQICCHCRDLNPTQGLTLWPRLIQLHKTLHSTLPMMLLKNGEHSHAYNYLCSLQPDGSITQKQEENAEHRCLWASSAVILVGSSRLQPKVPGGFKVSQSHYTWTTWVYLQQTGKLSSSHEYILTRAEITIYTSPLV